MSISFSTVLWVQFFLIRKNAIIAVKETVRPEFILEREWCEASRKPSHIIFLRKFRVYRLS